MQTHWDFFLLTCITLMRSPAPFSEMSGTAEDISQVHWKQQWLENGTLYFHVSMTESELLAQTTQSTAREPANVLHEHMHLLHISVMVSLAAFLCFSAVSVFILFNHIQGKTPPFSGCKLSYVWLYSGHAG